MLHSWHPQGNCGCLPLSLWVWACRQLVSLPGCSWVFCWTQGMSHVTFSAPACHRQVSVFFVIMPNAVTVFWIQLHKLWTGRETVLALRMLQQHMILLRKVPPIWPSRFFTLSFLWSSFKLTERGMAFLLQMGHALTVGPRASCFTFLGLGCPMHRRGVLS